MTDTSGSSSLTSDKACQTLPSISPASVKAWKKIAALRAKICRLRRKMKNMTDAITHQSCEREELWFPRIVRYIGQLKKKRFRMSAPAPTFLKGGWTIRDKLYSGLLCIIRVPSIDALVQIGRGDDAEIKQIVSCSKRSPDSCVRSVPRNVLFWWELNYAISIR